MGGTKIQFEDGDEENVLVDNVQKIELNKTILKGLIDNDILPSEKMLKIIQYDQNIHPTASSKYSNFRSNRNVFPKRAEEFEAKVQDVLRGKGKKILTPSLIIVVWVTQKSC